MSLAVTTPAPAPAPSSSAGAPAGGVGDCPTTTASGLQRSCFGGRWGLGGVGDGGAGGAGPAPHAWVQSAHLPVAKMPWPTAFLCCSHQFAGWQPTPLMGWLRCTQGWPPHLLPRRESVAATHAAQPWPLRCGQATPVVPSAAADDEPRAHVSTRRSSREQQRRVRGVTVVARIFQRPKLGVGCRADAALRLLGSSWPG